jgi:FMN phosphatase YigB (HAD superfamily)
MRAVVFDLGGVLARICHSWPEAASVAGVQISSGIGGSLTDCAQFNLYQAGALELEKYTIGLSEYLGCSPEEALRVHNGILIEEFPGAELLVREIANLGLATGCLSNTNAPHWERLALDGSFPAIHSLEMKMASHLAGCNKPEAAIYRQYCSQFGLEPSHIRFFDDAEENVLAARELGWDAVWIDNRNDPISQIRRGIA